MLEVNELSHRWPGGSWLFHELSFALAPGQVVTILGPNARGKTTLLKCVAGLLKPTSGKVRTQGQVGYVPQSHAVSHSYPVLDMVLMGRAKHIKPWSTPSKADVRAAEEAMETVGISHRRDSIYAVLSGGQRQLVLIARALVTAPSFLILDEPTSALDLKNQSAVLSLVNRLGAQGIGVLMTTHNPGDALNIASSTLILKEAGAWEFGASQKLLTSQSLSELYKTPICTACVTTSTGQRTVVVPELAAL